MIDIEIDLSDVKRCCNAAQHALVSHISVAVTRAAEEGVAEAKARRRYKDRTGGVAGLTGSAYARITRWDSRGADSVMGWSAWHASLVDGGTKAHDIYPRAAKGLVGPLPKGQNRGGKAKGAKALAFNGRFAAKVHHPGTQPDGFAGVAYQKAERVAVREIEHGAKLAEAAFSGR